jgi:hypothetical protein
VFEEILGHLEQLVLLEQLAQLDTLETKGILDQPVQLE